MPTYRYKCFSCYSVEEKFLPISSDPDALVGCDKCPDGAMRRIIGAMPRVIGLKTFAGDWFKKTYGHELGEDGEDEKTKNEEFEKALRQHNAENS